MLTTNAPMDRCTLAREKGLSMGAAAAAGSSGGATVSAVCPSMTLLQSSPSTARIRSNLQIGQRRLVAFDACPNRSRAPPHDRVSTRS